MPPRDSDVESHRPTFTFLAEDEQATERLAAQVAESLPSTLTIALVGTLGAGKTRFVQGLATALGVDRQEVVSPTFVLCQQYQGDRKLYHLDAYRLADSDEFLELGVDECFAEQGAITLIEWADRVEDCLPADHLRIDIEWLDDTVRQFQFAGFGPESAAVVRRLSAL